MHFKEKRVNVGLMGPLGQNNLLGLASLKKRVLSQP